MTDKQTLFISKYLTNGFHATHAAEDAGYSKKTAYSIGAELLKKPEIRKEIDKVISIALSAEETELKAKVIQALKAISESDISNYVNIVKKTSEKDGIEYYDLEFNETEKIDTTAIRAIKQNTQGGISIELYDKKAGLDLLGKYLSMFTENIHHSGEINTVYLDKQDEGV